MSPYTPGSVLTFHLPTVSDADLAEKLNALSSNDSKANKDHKESFKALSNKFMKGTATPFDAAQVESLLKADETNDVEVEAARKSLRKVKSQFEFSNSGSGTADPFNRPGFMPFSRSMSGVEFAPSAP